MMGFQHLSFIFFMKFLFHYFDNYLMMKLILGQSIYTCNSTSLRVSNLTFLHFLQTLMALVIWEIAHEKNIPKLNYHGFNEWVLEREVQSTCINEKNTDKEILQTLATQNTTSVLMSVAGTCTLNWTQPSSNQHLYQSCAISCYSQTVTIKLCDN
jgi:hypothetical protein